MEPCVSLPETSPTLLWTGKVGDASVFRVWGSRAIVHDTSADKLFARAIPCVFLGFVPNAPGWQFYHPTSRRILPSQDVTFDVSVPFCRLFPYRSAPPPPPPLFLAPGPPPARPPQGPAPAGVPQVDPLPGTAPVEVAVGSGAAPGAASGGAASRGAESGGAGSAGTGSGGAEPEGEEPGGVEPGGAESEGAESRGAESRGAEPRGAASPGGPAGASPRLSPPQLCEWLVRRARLRSGAPRAGGAGDAGAGGAGVTAGAGGSGGTAAAGSGGARTMGAGAVGTGGVGGAGAGDPTEPGAAGAGGSCVCGAGAGGAGAGGGGVGGTGAGGAGATGAGAEVLGVPPSTSLTPPLLCPPPDESQRPFQLASPLPAPSPYTEQSGGLTKRSEPVSRPASPVRIGRPFLVRSSLRAVPDPESDRALAASPTVSHLLATIVTNPSFESTAPSSLVAELVDFAAACRLDHATALVAESDSASPPSVGEAITVPYSSQWQTAMDAEMASWKSTGTYVDAVPPSRANVVDGMWIFRGIDLFHTFSPTLKMTTLRVLLHVGAQRDYELHSLDFSTTFLQGSLHEKIWLRRPPGFTGTTPAALGFTPSTADPSLFLRTDTSLPPFYILVYVDDLVFATADTETLTLLKSELQKRHTCTDLVTHGAPSPSALRLPVFSPQPTPLSTSHSLLAPPSDESVEASGPYPEFVGCLTYLMTYTRPDLAYPLSLLACYVAPGRHRMVHWDDAMRVLRYLLTDLGEQPRSPPVLYVDNKAMIALCQEHRLEHRTKHIALRYFLARELQQHGQVRLAYVATRANTAVIFTKALPPGDHQRFSTVLGLGPTLPHLLTP
ncbi:unnamed protein product [Closterium sp. NIES-53]